MLDNSVDCAATWYATAIAGAVHVPLNTALRGEFLRHPLRATGARFLIAEGDYLSRVPGVSDGGPEVLISRGSAPEGGPQPSASLAELERDRETPPVDADPASLMGVWYTGGTTGPSKGSMLSGNQVCEAAKSALRLTKRTLMTTFTRPCRTFTSMPRQQPSWHLCSLAGAPQWQIAFLFLDFGRKSYRAEPPWSPSLGRWCISSRI